MKKFICLILALTCAFSLFSCGNSRVDDIIEIVNSSEPDNIKTFTTYTSGGQLLSGSFNTDITGSEYVTTYSYQRYADPLVDGGDAYIKTVEGTVYYSNGKYSVDGENWSITAPDSNVINIKFKISAKKLGKAVVSSDGKTLTATISAADAYSMLGVNLSANDAGVTLKISTNGTNLTYVTISYVTASEASVVIQTSYTYN